MKTNHVFVLGLLALVAGCGSSSNSSPDSAGSATQYTVTVGGTGLALADADATTKPADDDVQACSTYFGKDVAAVKIVGSDHTVSLAPTDLLAVRITGNQNALGVKIAPTKTQDTSTATASSTSTSTGTDTSTDQSKELPSFAGVCFFLAGNQPSVAVSVDGFSLGKFGFIARGNQASGTLDVLKGAEVKDFLIDVKGNSGHLTVSGEGTYTCPADDSLTCTKK